MGGFYCDRTRFGVTKIRYYDSDSNISFNSKRRSKFSIVFKWFCRLNEIKKSFLKIGFWLKIQRTLGHFNWSKHWTMWNFCATQHKISLESISMLHIHSASLLKFPFFTERIGQTGRFNVKQLVFKYKSTPSIIIVPLFSLTQTHLVTMSFRLFVCF